MIKGPPTYHLVIHALLLEQLGVTTLLDELPFAEDEYDIGVLHSGKAMRHADHGPAPSGALERGLHELLALRIERARGLVQEKDVWVADERSGNGHALLLTSRKGNAAGSNVCVVPVWERDDEIVDRCIAACLVELLVRDRVRVDAEEDVVTERS